MIKQNLSKLHSAIFPDIAQLYLHSIRLNRNVNCVLLRVIVCVIHQSAALNSLFNTNAKEPTTGAFSPNTEISTGTFLYLLLIVFSFMYDSNYQSASCWQSQYHVQEKSCWDQQIYNRNKPYGNIHTKPVDQITQSVSFSFAHLTIYSIVFYPNISLRF